jgi:ribosome-associated toxin RatA of RatAB toxin-antitoxin module
MREIFSTGSNSSKKHLKSFSEDLSPKYNRLNPVLVTAIALLATMTLHDTAYAKPLYSTVNLLPISPQIASSTEQVIVSGDRGNYTAKVVVNAPVGKTWQVLTDYDNFEKFLPNVISSKLLQTNGNRKVFEQVSVISTILFTKKAKVRIAVTETYPKQISFRAVSGDVKSLQGVWKIKPVSGSKVVIMHQVTVNPGSTSNRDLFFEIYKNSLADSLAAIKQEIEQRSAN